MMIHDVLRQFFFQNWGVGALNFRLLVKNGTPEAIFEPSSSSSLYLGRDFIPVWHLPEPQFFADNQNLETPTPTIWEKNSGDIMDHQ